MADYLKLHRKMLNWGWYDDVNTCRLFIHCLLRANWKDGEWHGIGYKAGEFITSLETLANETSLTVRQVRTALNHLQATKEVTSKCQGKARIITVNNWNQYQASDKDDDKEVTRLRQDSDKIATTDIEVKNKDIKNNKYIYGEYKHVRLTQDQHEKLIVDFGEQATLDAIKFLDEYIQMKGYKAKDHYLAMRKWVYDAVKEEKAKREKQNQPQKKKGNAEIKQHGYNFSDLEAIAYDNN